MTALLLALIGVPFLGLFPLAGAWWVAKEEARGWKTSYEREKERADRQDAIVRDQALGTDIATKTASALHALMTSPEAKR